MKTNKTMLGRNKSNETLNSSRPSSRPQTTASAASTLLNTPSNATMESMPIHARLNEQSTISFLKTADCSNMTATSHQSFRTANTTLGGTANTTRVSEKSTNTNRSSSARSSEVAETVMKLLLRIFQVESSRTLSEEECTQAASRVYQYIMRILSSRITPTIVKDEIAILDSILKRLARSDSKAALSVQNLYKRLDNHDVLKSRWAVLYFLSALSASSGRTDEAEDSAIGTSLLDSHASFLTSNLKNMSLNGTNVDARSHSSTNTPKDDSQNSLKTPIPRTMPGCVYPWVHLTLCNPQFVKAVSNQHTTDSISNIEQELIRDLIYVFQGIDGKHVTFSNTQDVYVVSEQLNIPIPARSLVESLAETGYYYRKLSALISDSATIPDLGLTHQSFMSALSRELTEYFRLVAVLEGQASLNGGLTLKRLYVWMREPSQRIKMMSILGEMCKSVKGGALLSLLYAYRSHGDPAVQLFTSQLLRTVSVPFFKMLGRWLRTGDLDDPFEEFFIAEVTEVDASRMWREKYRVRTDMVPGFMSRGVVKRCLGVGKSIEFGRRLCSQADFMSGNNIGELNYDDLPRLEERIERIYDDVSRTLIGVLMDKFHFMDHLLAVKKYLLGGQGDFIGCMMDMLGPTLSNPATTLYRHNLTGILDSAIRSSNAQFDPVHVLKRLDVRILEPSNGDLGWDVFTLDYHFDAPLNTIFTAQAMNQYLRLFNFLWRVRRIGFGLETGWRKLRKIQLAQITAMTSDIHLIHTSLHDMIHFISQLQYYLLFEVLECSWDELIKFIVDRSQQDARGSSNKQLDLDLLIGAHNRFLNNITGRGLFNAHGDRSGSGGKGLLSQLLKIFDWMLEFVLLVDGVCALAVDEAVMKENEDLQRSKRSLEHQWGIPGWKDPTTLPAETFVDKLGRVRTKLRQVREGFEVEVTTFLHALGSNTDVNLRLFAFRLDHNQYYSRRIVVA